MHPLRRSRAAGAAGEADGTQRFSVTREELMSIVKDAVRNTNGDGKVAAS
jgi:hypothetical protein